MVAWLALDFPGAIVTAAPACRRCGGELKTLGESLSARPQTSRVRSEAARSRDYQKDPSWRLTFVHTFGLCGFALAQPLFALFGDNVTFLVAHDVDGRYLILFTAALLFVPSLVLMSVLAVTYTFSRSAYRVLRALVIGALAALTLTPALARVIPFGPVVFVLTMVAATTLCAVAYSKLAAVRSFATVLGAAPILFAGIFLLGSPAHVLLRSTSVVAADQTGDARTPVVLVVFDELPLGALLTPEGELDAASFSGFTQLAQTSTWYRNATTVAPWTHIAVPGILTGQLPAWDATPVPSVYPQSVFTMLGGSHDLYVNEAVTRLCPEKLCGASTVQRSALLKDTAIVYLRSILPDQLADGWVPEVADRWSGFGEAAKGHEPSTGERQEWEDIAAGDTNTFDQRARFEAFLSSITTDARDASFWYEHLLLPHVPFTYLPDGTVYASATRPPGLEGDWVTWEDNRQLTQVAQQRFMLQLGYVDSLIARLLDHMQQQDILDRALLIVTSDHGITFEPGSVRRGVPLDVATQDDVLPVPLFVKYPHQTVGQTDERPAQIIDVLPTITDVLQFDVPATWSFNGRSLLSEPKSSTTGTIVFAKERPGKLPQNLDATKMSRELRSLFGKAGQVNDYYRIGPYGDLVGHNIRSERVADLLRPVTGGPTDRGLFQDVKPFSGTLPALFTGRVVEVRDGSWVAIAINGTVSGIGPVYGGGAVTAMLDPSFFRAGVNDVAVYSIDPLAASVGVP